MESQPQNPEFRNNPIKLSPMGKLPLIYGTDLEHRGVEKLSISFLRY